MEIIKNRESAYFIEKQADSYLKVNLIYLVISLNTASRFLFF